jgi:class 3 adenylate cyclase
MNYNLSFRAKKEIKENEALLVQMMPPDVLENLENERVSTDRLHNVTLIFADIVGFTDWSSHKSPNEIVQMLSNLFTRFDKLCVEFDVYKVHTIGDCYVVMGYTGGKKKRDPSLECLNVLKMAYRMIEVIKEENSKHSSSLNMRIGVHTGEVIAGVIGTNIVRYDIWGPDVLIANKMESNGKPGRVKVSIDTREMIESRVQSGFEFEESDKIDVNAIGVSKRTFFVNCHDIELIKDVE